MKAASAELVAHLAAARASTAPLFMADCFTFTLINGTVLRYTSADIPIKVGAQTFVANSVLVSGLRYRASVGLEVDSQQIRVDADEDDVIAGGLPFMVAVRRGLFDRAALIRERAFLASWDAPAAVGSVIMFKGVIATVDQVGQTTALMTVNSELTYLDTQIPRNLYQVTCLHTHYDAGCGLNRNLFSAAGQVEAGSTRLAIVWAGAQSVYTQGRIVFAGGANDGLSATVRRVAGSVMTLSAPLPDDPVVGDAFTVYQGCDHTKPTCAAQFNNLANFRGFPFVPQAQMVI